MKRNPDKMDSILSLVRIINGKLEDVRTNDPRSLELLNDIQNSMDIVEKHCVEMRSTREETVRQPIIEEVEFNPDVAGPFAITSLGVEAFAITIGNQSTRYGVVDGKLYIAVADIASALGYKALSKFVQRNCQQIETRKIHMRWKAKGRPGMVAHDITCIDMLDAQRLIDRTNRYVKGA